MLGSIRQYYFQRRNRLVQTVECGRITGISGLNVTINATPLSFSTAVQYDLVKGTPGFQNLAIDQTVTGISGTTLTFSELPSTLSLGDYVCLAGESPIPQIPLEGFPLLSQQGVYVTLQALNDIPGAERAEKKRDEMLKQTMILVGIRSEDDQKTIVSQDNIGNFTWGFGGPTVWRR